MRSYLKIGFFEKYPGWSPRYGIGWI